MTHASFFDVFFSSLQTPSSLFPPGKNIFFLLPAEEEGGNSKGGPSAKGYYMLALHFGSHFLSSLWRILFPPPRHIRVYISFLIFGSWQTTAALALSTEWRNISDSKRPISPTGNKNMRLTKDLKSCQNYLIWVRKREQAASYPNFKKNILILSQWSGAMCLCFAVKRCTMAKNSKH